jgi:hypothetical protein
MSYASRLLVVVGAALVLTSCGGSSKSKDAAGTTPSQPAPSAAATGVTGASGASGATSSQTGPGKRKGSRGGASRANGTGGSGLPASTSGGKSGGSGSSGAGDQTASDQKKSDTAAQRKARRRARRERDAAPFFTSKQVYKQGKGGCHLLGINAIAREYRAASFKPKDVAKAYADAWVKGGAPERSRKAMFKGCLAGLKDNVAGR